LQDAQENDIIQVFKLIYIWPGIRQEKIYVKPFGVDGTGRFCILFIF